MPKGTTSRPNNRAQRTADANTDRSASWVRQLGGGHGTQSAKEKEKGRKVGAAADERKARDMKLTNALRYDAPAAQRKVTKPTDGLLSGGGTRKPPAPTPAKPSRAAGRKK